MMFLDSPRGCILRRRGHIGGVAASHSREHHFIARNLLRSALLGVVMRCVELIDPRGRSTAEGNERVMNLKLEDPIS